MLYRYCRGIDRRDYELVRSCYHPDATDDHGGYQGGVDGFIDYIKAGLPRFEQTMHMIGNIPIDIDGDVAQSEAYTLAFHRVPARIQRNSGIAGDAMPRFGRGQPTAATTRSRRPLARVMSGRLR